MSPWKTCQQSERSGERRRVRAGIPHDCADRTDGEAAIWGRSPPRAHDQADRDAGNHAVSVGIRTRRGEGGAIWQILRIWFDDESDAGRHYRKCLFQPLKATVIFYRWMTFDLTMGGIVALTWAINYGAMHHVNRMMSGWSSFTIEHRNFAGLSNLARYQLCNAIRWRQA
jgi:hypothetical protein